MFPSGLPEVAESDSVPLASTMSVATLASTRT